MPTTYRNQPGTASSRASRSARPTEVRAITRDASSVRVADREGAGPVFEVCGDLLESESRFECHGSRREVFPERVERNAGHDTRQRCARAYVRSVSEREVMIGVLAIDAERVGIVER